MMEVIVAHNEKVVQDMEVSDRVSFEGERKGWKDVLVCKECKHIAGDVERHERHMKESRHVHTFRSKAYSEPKKRDMWLKIWFSALEAVEGEDPWALAFDEEEEIHQASAA